MQVTLVANENELKALDADGKVIAMVPVKPIRALLQKRLGARVGWSPSAIKRRISAMARSVAKSKLIRQVKEVARHPLIAKGTELGSKMFPALGVSLAAAKAIYNSLEAARKGDYEAQKALAQLAILAKDGEPKAVASMNAAAKIYQLQRATPGVSGASIMDRLYSARDKLFNRAVSNVKRPVEMYQQGVSTLFNMARDAF